MSTRPIAVGTGPAIARADARTVPAHDHAGHDPAGHDHAGHDHAGHDHAGHDHAKAAPASSGVAASGRLSPLWWSAGGRLAVAGAFVAGLWLVIAWAVA